MQITKERYDDISCIVQNSEVPPNQYGDAVSSCGFRSLCVIIGFNGENKAICEHPDRTVPQFITHGCQPFVKNVLEKIPD